MNLLALSTTRGLYALAKQQAAIDAAQEACRDILERNNDTGHERPLLQGDERQRRP